MSCGSLLGKPAEQPPSHPAIQKAGRLFRSQLPSRPAIQPSYLASQAKSSRGARESGSQAVRQSGSQATNTADQPTEPTSQPANHPTIQPSKHPTIQPSNHPLANQAIRKLTGQLKEGVAAPNETPRRADKRPVRPAAPGRPQRVQGSRSETPAPAVRHRPGFSLSSGCKCDARVPRIASLPSGRRRCLPGHRIRWPPVQVRPPPRSRPPPTQTGSALPSPQGIRSAQSAAQAIRRLLADPSASGRPSSPVPKGGGAGAGGRRAALWDRLRRRRPRTVAASSRHRLKQPATAAARQGGRCRGLLAQGRPWPWP